MNNFPSFQEFFRDYECSSSPAHFITRLILAGLLSWVLTWVYVRYGSSLSNRRSFAREILYLSLNNNADYSNCKILFSTFAWTCRSVIHHTFSSGNKGAGRANLSFPRYRNRSRFWSGSGINHFRCIYDLYYDYRTVAYANNI